ncbi:MAG: DAPG hydrolase family protein [Acidimicrobiales bacterium]
MRSRFIQPPGVVEIIGAALLDHCYTEMTHLAGFLPHLYARVNATGPTT